MVSGRNPDKKKKNNFGEKIGKGRERERENDRIKRNRDRNRV